MKTFIEHKIPLIGEDNSGTGRRYILPSSIKVPSVTTVCGLLSRDSIKKWRKRVGNDRANIISNNAANRGTIIHKLAESYLKDIDCEPDEYTVDMFNSIIPHLNLIDNIHAIETKIYSEKLGTAGTVDLIGEYENVLSVIDFKTSAKLKRLEWITGYLYQTAAYAYMFTELTGIIIRDIVIIIGIDGNDAQIFREKVINWLPGFIKLRKQFREEYGY